MLHRWLKFHAVAALGMVLQLALLQALSGAAGWNYLWATLVAVEAAIVHNFFWHERWTWATAGLPGVTSRFWKYQLGTGMLSLVSNLFAMRLLAGEFGLPLLLANGVAIVVSGLINFLLGEFVVFSAQESVSARGNEATPPVPSAGRTQTLAAESRSANR